MMFRRSTAICAFVAASALVACTKVPSERPGAGRHPWTVPGVLRFVATEDPANLNPLLYSAQPTLNISMFVYSWAVRYDAKARPFPDALREIPTVANGDVSADGLTLKYKLRKNVRWQDGPPLTCADLRFTWRVVVNPRNDVATTEGYRDIGSIDCSDPYVAVVRMKRPYAPYLQQLWSVNGYAPILPEHILKKYNDDKGSFNTAPYNAHPIGSGPFEFVAWKRGEEIRLAANPNFYFGRPKANAVIFTIVPDQDTALARLRTHDVDLLWGSGTFWPILRPLVADAKNGLAVVAIDVFAWSHVDFNLERPVVADRNVRLALAYASDANAIVAKVLHGWAIPAGADQSPRLSWAYTNGVSHYQYDPQRARALLDAAGWKLGPNGIRFKDGRPLELTFVAARGDAAGKAEQTLLQREWREVGVQADVKIYSVGEFFDNSARGVLQGGRYDVAFVVSTAGPDPDDSASYAMKNLAPHGQNATRWKNRVADAAITDALRTVDQNRRRRDYAVVQRQLAHDLPTIVINFVRVPLVYNDDLRGFDPSPVVPVFWDPWNYSI